MAGDGNLITALHDAAAPRLGAPFLVEPGGTTLTYGEAFSRAAAVAAALHRQGVEPGDRVLVKVEKSADAVVLYLGCLHAGAVHVPLNPAFTRREVEYFVRQADPAVVIDDGALRRMNDQSTRILTTPTPRTPDDIAALLYTSGTTGDPKGAALTHGNLRENATALHRIWQFEPPDRLLHTLPIFHVHGLFVALHCAMLSAIPVTFLPRFSVDGVLDALPSATVMMGVPTQYARLLADGRLDRERTAGMRLFTCGSAPLSDSVFEKFTDRTGHRILERYGMSEAGIITSNPYDGDRVAGTVGFALPGVGLRVVDDAGRPVATGLPGAVEITGPGIMAGYWRNDLATAAAFTGDGHLRTGDVGSLDAEGRLTLQGRAGDMIISGGENIYPKEIELVLEEVVGIAESAVVGVPHPDFGEAVTAIVVADDVIEPGAIEAALADKLARFKHPKQVVTVDALPRNAMGKVQKGILRATFADLYDNDSTT